MDRFETIRILSNMIDYCKRELSIIDNNEQLSYQEIQDRKERLQNSLRGAYITYHNLTADHYRKAA